MISSMKSTFEETATNRHQTYKNYKRRFLSPFGDYEVVDLFEKLKNILSWNLFSDNASDQVTMGTNLKMQTMKNEEISVHCNFFITTKLGFMGSVYGEGTCRSGKMLIFPNL